MTVSCVCTLVTAGFIGGKPAVLERARAHACMQLLGGWGRGMMGGKASDVELEKTIPHVCGYDPAFREEGELSHPWRVVQARSGGAKEVPGGHTSTTGWQRGTFKLVGLTSLPRDRLSVAHGT